MRGLFVFESVSDVQGCAANLADGWEPNPHLRLGERRAMSHFGKITLEPYT